MFQWAAGAAAVDLKLRSADCEARSLLQGGHLGPIIRLTVSFYASVLRNVQERVHQIDPKARIAIIQLFQNS